MVISADKNRYSPPEFNVIKDVKSDIPLVLVTRLDDFKFNAELYGLTDYILVDMCEYEWDKELTFTHLFGKNTNDFKYRFPAEEWDKFDNWVKFNQPKLYFKRELLSEDATDKILPIDYPYYGHLFPTQTKDQFNGRPIAVFHYWGRSSEYRLHTHVNFLLNAGAFCDNVYYVNDFINKEQGERWISLHIPHYERIDISNLLAVNSLSKLSLSMKGCGYKCFRHAESPTNSIMVMGDTDIKFAFDWIHGVNCIKYSDNNPVPAIKEALKRNDLYEIYVRGMENVKNYQTENYTKHIENTIKSTM